MTATFDANEFAEWLTTAFKHSRFKSWAQVAQQVGTTRSTLSRLAGAKPQSLTGKPGQPNADLVIKLAKLFGEDVNEALIKGGHAPLHKTTEKPQNAAEFVQRLRDMGFDIQTSFDFEKLGPDDLQDIIDDIEAKLIYRSRRTEK